MSEELTDYQKRILRDSVNATRTKEKKNGATFEELYNRQKKNQEDMIRAGLYDDYVDFVTKSTAELPFDYPKLASYHIQQLVSEIGEILEADKRWKNIRNGKYDRDGKLDEISDCMIVLFNIAMYSGYTAEELQMAISNKMDVVSDRIDKERVGH